MEDLKFFGRIILVAVLGLSAQTPALRADTPSSPTSITAPVRHVIDPTLLAKGTSVYQRLKQLYPDAPNTGQWEVPPHAVGVFLSGNTGDPGLDLVMPTKAWDGLSAGDRKALVEFLRDQVRHVQANPDPFTQMSPSAPAYLAYRQEQQAIKDDAWRIRVGHMDDDNYLVPDKTVLNGPDYSEIAHDVPVFVYADSKVDPVYGSALDGSVQQVKEYLAKTLNDSDSIEYVEWTRVLKTGVGFQVTVVYRAKNAYGAFIRKDQTFTLDHQGKVTEVKTNEQ